MSPRAATAATEAATAALSLEITEEFSRVRSLNLAVTFRIVEDAWAVLSISDPARARTLGRRKQLLVRKACGDDAAVLRYTPKVEFMARQLMATLTRATNVCAGGSAAERAAWPDGGAFPAGRPAAAREYAWPRVGGFDALNVVRSLDGEVERRRARYARCAAGDNSIGPRPRVDRDYARG